MKKRICLYVNEDIWKEFTSISHREGETASGKTEQFFKQYNEKHRVGNPQLRLDSMLQLKIAKECSHPNCDNPAAHEAWGENKSHVYLCQTHFFRDKDARLLKRWRKLESV